MSRQALWKKQWDEKTEKKPGFPKTAGPPWAGSGGLRPGAGSGVLGLGLGPRLGLGFWGRPAGQLKRSKINMVFDMVF